MTVIVYVRDVLELIEQVLPVVAFAVKGTLAGHTTVIPVLGLVAAFKETLPAKLLRLVRVSDVEPAAPKLTLELFIDIVKSATVTVTVTVRETLPIPEIVTA